MFWVWIVRRWQQQQPLIFILVVMQRSSIHRHLWCFFPWTMAYGQSTVVSLVWVYAGISISRSISVDSEPILSHRLWLYVAVWYWPSLRYRKISCDTFKLWSNELSFPGSRTSIKFFECYRLPLYSWNWQRQWPGLQCFAVHPIQRRMFQSHVIILCKSYS